jgi:hypothetical protein
MVEKEVRAKPERIAEVGTAPEQVDWGISNDDMRAYQTMEQQKQAAAADMQKFIDDFGPVGKVYGDAVDDRARFGRFQERMYNLRAVDPQAFEGLAKLGLEMRDNPQLKSEEVGTRVADILAETLKKAVAPANGEAVNLTQPAAQELIAPFSGMMLAETSRMRTPGRNDTVKAMVDAFDERMRINGADSLNVVNGFDKPVRVHGIRYSDGEPGIMVYPDGDPQAPKNRHDVP